MKRFLQILPLVLFLSGLFVLIYSRVTTGSDLPVSESQIVNLENSIIINDIRMDSDTPPADDENDEYDDGKILYRNDFNDKNIENSIESKSHKKKGLDLSELNRMKKTDSKWHLTKYKIKPNDNIWKIAKKFHTEHDSIIKINRVTDPDSLKPGKILEIPNRSGLPYTVNSGDTLARISDRFNVPREKIIFHNKINDAKIRAGMKIFIPDAVAKKEVKAEAPRVVKTKKPGKQLVASGLKFSWPIVGKITSGFGNRLDPFSNTMKFHCGLDISANAGTPVMASADGTVIFSGWKDGYGNVVIMRHEGGYISVYAHNSKNLVSENSVIPRGKLIALSGMTGLATGGHLHFEIRKFVTPLNPLRMMK
jgi:LysM repeat protein